MAKIPAAVWIAIGLVVTFISWRVGAAFKLFLYLGIVFMVWGALKFFLSMRTKPVQHAAHTTHNGHHNGHYCPRCRHVVHPHDFFCSKCGQRLR